MADEKYQTEEFLGSRVFSNDSDAPVAYVEVLDPNMPRDHYPDESIMARVHPDQGEQGGAPGLTVTGNIDPETGFSGNITVIGPANPPQTVFTNITFENGCAVKAEEALQGAGIVPIEAIAEAMNIYETTAVQLATMPEVQSVVDGLRTYMERHGVSLDDAGVNLAAGRTTPECRMF